MPVLRSHRTYPLSLTADALNTGIIGAYDWAGDPANSWAGGSGADHSGNAKHYTAATGATIVVQNIGGEVGMNGRDFSNGLTLTANFAKAAGVAALGMAVGTGDYTIWVRVRTPTAAVAATRQRWFGNFRDTVDHATFGWYEVVATGKYHFISSGGPNIIYTDGGANNWFDAGQIVDIHIRRLAGTVTTFLNGVAIESTADAGNWTTGGTASACYFGTNSTPSHDTVIIDEILWTRGLSNAEVAAHRANPYAYYTNSAPADSITVTTPAAGATVGTNFTIAGTYGGANNPTTIEASFNGSAYQTIDAAPAGGAFTGTFTGATPGTGTLTVRWSNSTGVSTTVASLTVTSAAIAFAVGPDTTTGAVAHRTFQRNGSNTASVRLTGTYIGSPASIEYRWAGAAWSTLVASPAGGTFDQTVTLTGPGQGALEVRFSNNTAVTASLANVAVGDVYLCAGQSNHMGISPVYVLPVAPGANPGWVACEFDKTNTWRPNAEAVGQKFDDATGSPYAVYSTGGQGSYFGRLATRIMATGIPVAFVPCAKGSTTIANWASAGSLYAAMADRAAIIGAHKAVLWWQGESDAGSGAGTTQAAYEAALNAIIDAWWASKGTPFVLCNINDQGITGVTEVRAALAAVAATHLHADGPVDMLGAWAGGVHYETSGAIDEVSLRMFSQLYPAATLPAGLAQETDTALPLGAALALPVGLAAETDTALALGIAAGGVAVGLAVELDVALARPASLSLGIGVASEADVALALGIAGAGGAWIMSPARIRAVPAQNRTATVRAD